MASRHKYLGFAFIILSVVSTAFIFTDPRDRTFDIMANLEIFATLYQEVNEHYVDEVNPTQLMQTGIGAMLQTLDPYTTFISENDIEDYRTMTTGQYGGIGAIVDKRDGESIVILPYAGYPAERAGIKAGDKILAIDGIELKDRSADEISRLLKGQANSTLKLTVKRHNKEPFDVELSRERITISNVPYAGMLTDEIGYVRLSDFTSEAGLEVKNAVQDLKAEGAKKIVLDLRGNPGGLLEEAVNVSNIFIDKGMEVVTTKGKLQNSARTYRTLNKGIDTQIPMAVLVSNTSASASEIVAGVVQDYDRGILVGQRSFGKGLVQQTRPLAYNSQLKVTTAKYYIPSGRCIQAIDYSLRNPDGSVGKTPDSLKNAFKTRAGRVVYDGGGVNPDVEVEETDYAPITYSLMASNYIFNYATEYYYAHPEAIDPRTFALSDSEYSKFIGWLEGKDLDYTSQVERDIEQLIASAKEEQYYEDIKEQIMDLKRETLHNKDNDLLNFKMEIKMLLEREIAGRYFYQAGMIESMFDQDKEVQAAIKVLSDPGGYSKLLTPQ